MEAIDPNSSGTLLQLGIGCVIILVLDRVVNIVRLMSGGSRDGAKSSKDAHDKIECMRAQVRDLHNWHNQKDSDGVFLWNVPRSLEKSIARLGETVDDSVRVSAENKQLLLTLQRVVAETCWSARGAE